MCLEPPNKKIFHDCTMCHTLQRLDPKTGKVVEYPLPVLKPEFSDYV